MYYEYKIYKINDNKSIIAVSINDIFKFLKSTDAIYSVSIYDLKNNLLLEVNKSQLDILNGQLTSINKDYINQKCGEMKRTCPENSREFEPILMYEDWCDIPPDEYVKNNQYFNQCYRLANLLQHFEAGLTQKKNNFNNPKYPFDPMTRKKISIEELLKVYHQAEDANVDIPPVFMLFMKALYEGLININEALAPEEKEGHISPEYINFINDFNKHVKANEISTEIDQESLDLINQYQNQY